MQAESAVLPNAEADRNVDTLLLRDADLLKDEAFIFATFLQSLYSDSAFWKEIRKDKFMLFYHIFLEKLFAKDDTNIKVLCLKEDPDVIIGYMIMTRGNILHYIFVKRRWRNMGLAKWMLPKTIDTVTHLTKAGEMIFLKKLKCEFDPFVAWN